LTEQEIEEILDKDVEDVITGMWRNEKSKMLIHIFHKTYEKEISPYCPPTRYFRMEIIKGSAPALLLMKKTKVFDMILPLKPYLALYLRSGERTKLKELIQVEGELCLFDSWTSDIVLLCTIEG
jgi:hypothetical protein